MFLLSILVRVRGFPIQRTKYRSPGASLLNGERTNLRVTVACGPSTNKLRADILTLALSIAAAGTLLLLSITMFPLYSSGSAIRNAGILESIALMNGCVTSWQHRNMPNKIAQGPHCRSASRSPTCVAWRPPGGRRASSSRSNQRR